MEGRGGGGDAVRTRTSSLQWMYLPCITNKMLMYKREQQKYTFLSEHKDFHQQNPGRVWMPHLHSLRNHQYTMLASPMFQPDSRCGHHLREGGTAGRLPPKGGWHKRARHELCREAASILHPRITGVLFTHLFW